MLRDAGKSPRRSRDSSNSPLRRSRVSLRSSAAALDADDRGFLSSSGGIGGGAAGSSSIKVAVRVRPFSACDAVSGVTASADGSCLGAAGGGGGGGGGGSSQDLALGVDGNTVVTKPVDKYGMESEYAKERVFSFDEVFASTQLGASQEGSQEDVFQALGAPLIDGAMDAYNGCVLAYGQTGTGKSYSVLGDLTNPKDSGLLPRCCERLFEMVSAAKSQHTEADGTSMQVAVLASYLEIYQEKMFDLLANTHADLQVRLHPTLGPHVPSLTESPVTTVEEIRRLIDFGSKNRMVGATFMNASSSRSHAVFTIDLRTSVGTPGAAPDGPEAGAGGSPRQSRIDLQSKLHFVDLAGSERVQKTKASGERLQEGIAINQSLSALSRVIQVLAGNQRTCIKQPPFRESKLTLLLKDALLGNSRTVLVACISPIKGNLEETISTLEFAARCKLVKTSARRNETDRRSVVDSLSDEKRQIEEQLQREVQQRLALQDDLVREMEQTRQSQALALQMREEKLAIEQQLRALDLSPDELPDPGSPMERHRSVVQRVQLRQAEQELQLVRKAHEATQREWARLHREHASKLAELTRLHEEREHSEEDKRRALQEAECLRQEKEAQVQQAEREREEALARLELACQQQQQEQLEWQEMQRRSQVRAQELEDALEQREADLAERSRLERERNEVLETLRKAGEEFGECKKEAERLCRKRETQLAKVDEERRRAVQQFEVLQKRQLSEHAELEALLQERDQQAQDLRQLQDLRDREQEQHRQLRAELQQQLAELRNMEEQEQRRSEEEQSSELEHRELMEQELQQREEREEHLRCELQDLQSLSDSWALEKKGLEMHASELRRSRDHILNELGVVADEHVAEGRKHREAAHHERSGHTPQEEEDFADAVRNFRQRVDAGSSWVRGVLAAITALRQELGNSGASALLEDAVSASQAIAEANDLVRLLPDAPWVEGVHQFDLAVLLGADSRCHPFSASVCVVTRRREEAEKHPKEATASPMAPGVWEVLHFQEHRLPYLRQMAASSLESSTRQGSKSSSSKRGSQTTAAGAAATAAARERRRSAAAAAKRLSSTVTAAAQAAAAAALVEGVEVAESTHEATTGDAASDTFSLDELGRGLRESVAGGVGEATEMMADGVGEVFNWISANFQDSDPTADGDADSVATAEVTKEAAFTPRGTSRNGTRASSSGKSERKTLRRASSAAKTGRKSHFFDASLPEVPSQVADDTSAAIRGAVARGSAAVVDAFESAAAAVAAVAAANFTGGSESEQKEASAVVAASPVKSSKRRTRRGTSRASLSSRKSGGPQVFNIATDAVADEEVETVDIRVAALVDGKLGIRLRSENLTVSGFDDPQAAQFGWRLWDEVIAVNGSELFGREDFAREVAVASQALPMVFTVRRRNGASSSAPTHRSLISAVAGPGLVVGGTVGGSMDPTPADAAPLQGQGTRRGSWGSFVSSEAA